MTATLDGKWEHDTISKDTLKMKDWDLCGLLSSKVSNANEPCSALRKILLVMVAAP